MKIKHLILAFGGASLLAACNLDEYPYGFYSESAQEAMSLKKHM